MSFCLYPRLRADDFFRHGFAPHEVIVVKSVSTLGFFLPDLFVFLGFVGYSLRFIGFFWICEIDLAGIKEYVEFINMFDESDRFSLWISHVPFLICQICSDI
ncbi:hypothetical protein Droror1_Dr00009308 [Drosera rotundifolia]